jgi:hypothetical protein
MKPVLEQKLREFIAEADQQVAPAMSTVLKLLLGAYLRGKQNDFAKHCCQFSPLVVTGAAINSNQEGEDIWPDSVPEPYIN